MALFSRRRRDADAATDPDKAEDASASAAPAPAEPSAAPEPDSDAGAGEPSDPAPEATEHLKGGPFDEGDAPDGERFDLSGLRVPGGEDVEVRLIADPDLQMLTTAELVIGDSSLALVAVAAPKTKSLWEEIRGGLRTSISRQGGTMEIRDGLFGTELVGRLPVARADGRTTYRPARFIGIDGPRWLLRAMISGPAVHDPQATRRFEELLSDVVVVRGGGAMAPKEVIELAMPGERPGARFGRTDPEGLDPLARGPEITQIG